MVSFFGIVLLLLQKLNSRRGLRTGIDEVHADAGCCVPESDRAISHTPTCQPLMYNSQIISGHFFSLVLNLFCDDDAEVFCN